MWEVTNSLPSAAASTAQWLTPLSLCFLLLPQLCLLSSHWFVQWSRALWLRQHLPYQPQYSFINSDSLPSLSASAGRFNHSPVARARLRNSSLDDPPYLLAFLIHLHPAVAAVLLRAPDWPSLGPFVAWVVLSAFLSLLSKPALPSCSLLDIPFLISLALPVVFCTRVSTETSFLRDDQYEVVSGWPVLSLIRLTASNILVLSYVVLRGFNRIGTVLDVQLSHLPRFLFAVAVMSMLGVVFEGFQLNVSEHFTFFNGVGAFLGSLFLIGLPQTIFFQGVVQELMLRTFEMESSRVEFSEDDDDDFITLGKPVPKQGLKLPPVENYDAPLLETSSINYVRDEGVSVTTRLVDWLSLPSWQEWFANCISSLVFAFTVSIRFCVEVASEL
eukprot:TRINITY_DN4817_c0_g1_i2.p1 TRINITY_DN4817_c0_g1~~TRINITY_DN4817_c0_g1_i2.p1  ORF type:complete len:395 (+),score=61.38 TRINITY_DN4817_c0_g1_i2:25-1185(+)